jgi:hypothetical protein
LTNRTDKFNADLPKRYPSGFKESLIYLRPAGYPARDNISSYKPKID